MEIDVDVTVLRPCNQNRRECFLSVWETSVGHRQRRRCFVRSSSTEALNQGLKWTVQVPEVGMRGTEPTLGAARKENAEGIASIPPRARFEITIWNTMT